MSFHAPILTGLVLGAINVLGTTAVDASPSIVVALSSTVALFGGCLVWMVKSLMTTHARKLEEVVARQELLLAELKKRT